MYDDARFTKLPDKNDLYLYSYNPCKAFTDGDCKYAHVCTTVKINSMYLSS